MSAAVSLLVITLDGRGHLEAFLPTVAAQDYPGELEVVVVDNGSTDGSAAWLAAHHPHVRVVSNPRNLGFARANNQAAEAATGRYVILVNNDMRLEPGFVRELVAAKEAGGEGLACVGARILSFDGQTVDFEASGMTFDGKGLQLGHGAAVGAPPPARELLFACGGAMLVERSVYLAVEGLDEDFFAYYEDVDFGWRLWVLGYRVELAPKAVCYHFHNGTSRHFAAHRKLVLLERNALAAMLKNHDDRSLAAFWPAALLLAFKRAAVRSGLDRAAWAFTREAAPAPVPQAPAWRKLARALKRQGVRQATRKALYHLGLRLARACSPSPSGAPDETVPITPGAYATLVAVEDLIDLLPTLLAKRGRIQAARRRADGEIFSRFQLPFEPVEGLGNYPAVQEGLVQALGLPPYFAMRQAEASPRQVPCETSS